MTWLKCLWWLFRRWLILERNSDCPTTKKHQTPVQTYICKHEIRLKGNKENSPHVAYIFSWKLLKTQTLILALIPRELGSLCKFWFEHLFISWVYWISCFQETRERESVCVFLVQYGSWFFWDFWICKYLSDTLF